MESSYLTSLSFLLFAALHHTALLAITYRLLHRLKLNVAEMAEGDNGISSHLLVRLVTLALLSLLASWTIIQVFKE